MRLWVALATAVVTLSAMVACEHPNSGSGSTADMEVDTDKNEWVYTYKEVGPMASTIWKVFIDTREVALWQVYLSPVKDIEFEEVFGFSPVKITLPIDFPLDGTRVRLAEEASIRVVYDPEWWDASNAPNGFVCATYDYRNGHFEITFHTSSRLKGHYSGPLTIIE